jgi:SAM-dependent methyltransferase
MSDYDRYSEWKGWISQRFLSATPHEIRYFQGELRGLPLNGARLLEIGFGNGSFLRYALDHGAIIGGTEVLEEAVKYAMQRGIRVYRLDLLDALEESAGEFDLVAAFDVLEHMTLPQISDLFELLAKLLKPGGHVIARFPNGQSPFGRVPQYGDHTHRSVLSAPLLMQLLVGKPWGLVRVGNPFMVIQGNGLYRWVGSWVRFVGRTVAERAVNGLYGLDITLDPNVTVLLRRLGPGASDSLPEHAL